MSEAIDVRHRFAAPISPKRQVNSRELEAPNPEHENVNARHFPRLFRAGNISRQEIPRQKYRDQHALRDRSESTRLGPTAVSGGWAGARSGPMTLVMIQLSE